MAFEVPGFKLGTQLAGQDLTAAQFLFVKIHTNGQIIKCATSGEAADGVLQSKVASGASADVMVDGVSKVIAGAGGIALGDQVTPNASGQAIVAASTDAIAGRCLVAASSGNIGTIELLRQGKK